MRVEHVMGTAVRFATEGKADGVEEAISWLHWVDDTFSAHKPDSQIMRIWNGRIAKSCIDPEVRVVLERCNALRILTDGDFDHRPESQLDPSGYVKGWAIERAAAILDQAGLTRFYIDAGGDIVVRGPWKVGISNPLERAEPVVALRLENQAIATSGRYERGDHIWGGNRAELASVSVIGPDLGTADALSTALFSAGDHRQDWLQRFPGYEVVAIDGTNQIWASPHLLRSPRDLSQAATAT